MFRKTRPVEISGLRFADRAQPRGWDASFLPGGTFSWLVITVDIVLLSVITRTLGLIDGKPQLEHESVQYQYLSRALYALLS